jgi:peptidyl-prolyl cis-trans isomerase SurA
MPTMRFVTDRPTPIRRRFAPLVLACAALAAVVTAAVPGTPARAQGLFQAALYVNDDAITNYEITQKMRFLAFIGQPGENPRERAIERLIEDRLQVQEVQRLGGRLTPDQVQAGIAEFAARANLTPDELFARAAGEGVDRDTIVQFIRAGIMWRELVRSLYGATIQVTDAQIDQALSVAGLQPVTEVLMSELFLPSDPQYAQAVERIVPQILRIRTETDFANAARQVSAAPSGAAGGRVDRWVNISALPPAVASAFESAAIGAVLGPFELPGALAFFQLRARREARSVPAEAIELDYMRTALPGGNSDTNRALLAQVRDEVDSCVDFPAAILRAMPSLPAEAVERLSQSQTEVPGGVRAELERLNPGQIAASSVQDGALMVYMLCGRVVGGDIAPPREQVRVSLMNRALEGQALIYLQRLRAEADIRYN